MYCADTRHSANVWVKVKVRVKVRVGVRIRIRVRVSLPIGLGLGSVGIVDFQNSGPKSVRSAKK